MSSSQTKKQGKDGIELSSLEWLLLHHRVKLLERQEIIRKLDIQRGDHVLDLGCGPGLWTQILADAVGPAGRVVGVDFDEDHLAYARGLTDASHPDSDIHYSPLDFSRIADLNETFDVVYFSNCFCYLPDPSPVIEQIKRITRPGGRVIGRNWDGGPFLLYPMREQLLSLVQHQIANVLEDTSDGAYFDHYLGRQMPGIFSKHGFNHVTCYTQIIERFGAADSDLAAYIKLNGEWMGDKVAGSVDAETLAEWLACFEPGDPRCVFESDEFYFCMTEMAVTGYV